MFSSCKISTLRWARLTSCYLSSPQSHFHIYTLSSYICQFPKEQQQKWTPGYLTICATNKKYFWETLLHPCPRKTPEIRAEAGRHPVGGPLGGGGTPVLMQKCFKAKEKISFLLNCWAVAQASYYFVPQNLNKKNPTLNASCLNHSNQ